MKLVIAALLVAGVAGHGAMVSPAPRSAHKQTLDDANKCGSSNPYSTTGIYAGEYCGLGCLGDACLYYQVGCFAGCGTCSLTGKDLYPTASDLQKAGNCKPIEPTLGGGDPAHEYELRTHNVDNDSWMGDWTKGMPWRAPGSTGTGNPDFQPCGVNSGSSGSLPPTTSKDVPIAGPGTALPSVGNAATWKAGDVVEASWAIYANHGGGYSYRLCKKDGDKPVTEVDCQKIPLDFVGNTTEIRFTEEGKAPITIDAVQTNVGTFPKGSMWRKNPIPMCNCDIGIGCGKREVEEVKTTGGKTCTPDVKCDGTGGFNCKQCGDASTPSWSCKSGTCCPGTTEASFAGGVFCKGGKPGPSPSPSPSKGSMYTTYPKTHFHPGQTSKLCPTGVQFETKFDEGVGAMGSGGRFGTFDFQMVDKLQIPKDLEAGGYVLSWRWDCEETPQVWNSCADVTIE